MTSPRLFRLQADDAVVADGVQWPDGTVAIHSRHSRDDDHRDTIAWLSMDHAEQIRTYGTRLDIVWDVSEPIGGSQPWAAYLAPQRDGDGHPTTIHVGRTDGARVAASDVQWVRNRLNHGGHA